VFVIEPKRTGRPEAKAESIACSGRLFVIRRRMSYLHWQQSPAMTSITEGRTEYHLAQQHADKMLFRTGLPGKPARANSMKNRFD
jgi:hypothetical protein